MAYAIIAGVPAVNGLYVVFFNVLLYVLLGTSKHLSAGTYSIVSIIVATSIRKYDGVLFPKPGTVFNETTYQGDTSRFLSYDPVEGAVMVSTALAFTTGIIHVLLALLHVGFVTKFLSDSIVGGFTCGSAIVVIFSQVKNLLGLTLDGIGWPLVTIATIYDICKNILTTNMPTVLVSIVTLIFLYLVKFQVNERFKKKLAAPLPAELVVVVVGTAVSYALNLEQSDVKVVGDLKPGFPKFTFPPLQIFFDVIWDSISIAIISFAM
jgi:MFS superfamily sulfate permease-like transporter